MNWLRISKRDVTYILFCFLILSNLLLGLLPAWRGSFIWKYLPDIALYFKITGYGAIIINFLVSMPVLLLNTKIHGKKELRLCFICMSVFTLSMLQNGLNFKLPEGFMALCVYIMIFGVLSQYNFGIKMQNTILLILLFWSITPVLYFLVAPLHIKMLFYSIGGTFSGFALHRNFYGVYAGITFLLLTFATWPKKYKYPLYVLLLVGILMSECRTVFLCLFISMFYKQFSTKRFFFFYVMIAGVLGFICYSLLMEILADYTMRNDFDNNVARQELYQGFWNEFIKNPLLGKGEDVMYYSSSYPEGSPAHNLLLQILASYGVFELLFFALFYWAIFQSFSVNGKALFLYIIVTSMFQPYVDTGFPTVMTMIILFLCQIYSNSELRYAKK